MKGQETGFQLMERAAGTKGHRTLGKGRVYCGATLGHGAPRAVQQPRGTGTTTLGSSGQAPRNGLGGHNADRMILPLSRKNPAK